MCNKKESFLYYQKYNSEIKPIIGEKYIFKYVKLNHNEKSWEILKGDSIIYKTKIKVDTIGLFYYCDNKYYLTHTFNEAIKPEAFCMRVYPFFHKENEIVNSKVYEIDKHPYKVICYSEMSSEDNSNITYYLDGFGFICYYVFFTGDMYLCVDVKNAEIKTDIIKGIVNLVISDTAFFVKYRKPKLIPSELKFLAPDSTSELKVN